MCLRVLICGFADRRIVFGGVRLFFDVMWILVGFVRRRRCRVALLVNVVIINEIADSFTIGIIVLTRLGFLLSLRVRLLCENFSLFMPLVSNRNYKILSCLNVVLRISC